MDPNYTLRRTIYGGVLFGVAVLAVIYYIDTHRGGEDAEPAAAQPPETSPASADPQAAVLETIRSRAHGPDAKIKIVQWWATQRVALNGVERFACRVVYDVEEGGARTRRDGAFDLEGPLAVPVEDGPEGARTHRRLDPLFHCENCPFGPGASPNAAPKQKQKK
jgi:hypothetical protein